MEVYEPTVSETLQEMAYNPLTWIDITVIFVDIYFIGTLLPKEGISVPVIGFFIAMLCATIALYYVYSFSQSKIRIRELDKQIDANTMEIVELVTQDGGEN